MTTDQISASTLSELADRLRDCQRCELGKTRTNLVFGVGDAGARLMFIGEAPGFHEDRQGEPFVGTAGKLLDDLLLRILGLRRSDIYIGNVLKCRPPQNRDPLPDEINSCKPFIARQIELIDPKIICTLGNFSTRLLLNKNVYISKVHGQLFRTGSRLIFPTYHPAAALYTNSTKELLVADFKLLADRLMEFEREPAESDSAPAAGSAEQLGLF